MRYDLAVIVPTLNEVGNIGPLLRGLDAALAGLAWEVVFVDDGSTDGTVAAIRAEEERRGNVRCLSRVGRRGLSSAVIEGFMATGAPVLAVMDADLQHDPALLPLMLARLDAAALDLVVASRFLPESGLEDFSATRERLSGLGTALARRLLPVPLSDPLSGLFMVRRAIVEEVAPRLNGQGFKILLDILTALGRPPRLAELPFTFRKRHSGQSKLDLLVGLEFLMLLIDRVLGRTIPVRFVLFVLVGLTGVVVHVALLGLLLKGLGWDFYPAQGGATLIAMTSNFVLNNRLTHRDRRLAGWGLVRGLLSFYAACAIGAVINLQVAEFLWERNLPWALAGVLGATLSSVWNYGVTSTFTWRRT